MNKVKLTPWFPTEIPPVRSGVYERSIIEDDGLRIEGKFQYWNGNCWCSYGSDPDLAFRIDNRTRRSEYQHGQWRGILK